MFGNVTWRRCGINFGQSRCWRFFTAQRLWRPHFNYGLEKVGLRLKLPSGRHRRQKNGRQEEKEEELGRKTARRREGEEMNGEKKGKEK